MRITIIGKGNVGKALGANLARHGHAVVYAVREPDAADQVPLAGAADDADVAILAVPFMAAAEALAAVAPPADAVVVDATNPFGAPVPDGAASGAESIALAHPHVRLVKTFNVVGWEHMADPATPAGPVTMPVAGDDDEARAMILELAREMGFDAIDVGGLDASAATERAAMYWGLLAMRGGLGRGFALVAVRTAS